MLKKIIAVVVGFIVILSTSSLFAQTMWELPQKYRPKEVPSLKSFKDIPILDQGRIKPLDTYARNILLQFSGRRSFNRKPAVEWLARHVFAPDATRDDKIFLINNPDIPMALGIEPVKNRRYSFEQIEPQFRKLYELASAAYRIDAKEQTIVEKEAIRTYSNVDLYVKLSHTFRFAIPHMDYKISNAKVVAQLGLSPKQEMFSFLDVLLKSDVIQKAVANIDQKNSKNLSDRDEEFLKLQKYLRSWVQFYQNLPFHIMPSKDSNAQHWLSSFDSIGQEFNDTAIREEITLLRDMTMYYWNNEQLAFDLAARTFKSSIKKRVTQKDRKGITKIPLEIRLNKGNFFLWAKLAYGLAFLIFLIGMFWSKEFLRYAALALLVVGFIPHTYGIILRCMIMERPPVTNLFETFVFVAYISVFLGFIVELVNKRWLGIMSASVCGLIFLFLAGKFGMDGDTMRVLVAVLDSNFWLATHVITISMGYAGCCVAGLIGHVYIIQGLTRPKDKALLNSTYQNILGTLAFGLALTFLGTTLGGIWADESWGRFWGWDPKENGALLLILWCAIIFHAKAGRMIGPIGVATMSAIGIIVVMGAWFGVNLLNVGLHSYGFTSGIAQGLLIYVVCECLFLAITVPMVKKKVV